MANPAELRARTVVKLFLAPHNDDETLFGAFTIQREQPAVVVVYDSYIQVARGAAWCDKDTRRRETCEAVQILLGDAADLQFCGLRDDEEYSVADVIHALMQRIPDGVALNGIIAPAHELSGHVQHNLVADAAAVISRRLSVPLLRYATYTRTWGKSRSERIVPTSAEGIRRKLLALARYESQIRLDDCRGNFIEDLLEYYL